MSTFNFLLQDKIHDRLSYWKWLDIKILENDTNNKLTYCEEIR